MGISDESWESLQAQGAPVHEWERGTELTADLHICLEKLHMRYPEYMAVTSRMERHMYRLYLWWEGEKQAKRAEHEKFMAESEREIMQPPRVRTR